VGRVEVVEAGGELAGDQMLVDADLRLVHGSEVNVPVLDERSCRIECMELRAR
jgi:hypothetical protein